MVKNLGVIGGGAWGTALAKNFASKFDNVYIYPIEETVINSINNNHENKLYLPNFILPKNLMATTNYKLLNNCQIILLATPTQYIRETAKVFHQIKDDVKILICAKGFEISSQKLISEVLQEVLGHGKKIGVLSGPTFAKDVANNLPAAMVIAMEDILIAKEIANLLSGNTLRVYYNDDVIGTQVGGAVKNVIAIAAGIISGAELGHNALAGIITRGLKEILSLAIYLGGKEATIFGLSGLGDLVLTTTSENSRNFSFGQEIGKLGRYNKTISTNIKGIAEGYYTAEALHKLMLKIKIAMPICAEVYKICYEEKLLKDCVSTLMLRQIKEE